MLDRPQSEYRWPFSGSDVGQPPEGAAGAEQPLPPPGRVSSPWQGSGDTQRTPEQCG